MKEILEMLKQAINNSREPLSVVTNTDNDTSLIITVHDPEFMTIYELTIKRIY